jgi:beta-mannosidase
VPERAWIYRSRFSGAGGLELAGVDHAATVSIDGEQPEGHVGMFTPLRVDVGPGDHLLAVVVHPAPPSRFGESFPNAWCTAALDYRGLPKPAYWGVARAYRARHASAQFATCAWGGEAEVRARIHGDRSSRIVDLHGTVVSESRDELTVPLGSIATDVFVLDLGGINRYVMTRTDDLAPLLEFPPAQLERTDRGTQIELRNTGGVAAIGVLVHGAVSDNVLDLLPGETRTIEVDGDVALEGWNV